MGKKPTIGNPGGEEVPGPGGPEDSRTVELAKWRRCRVALGESTHADSPFHLREAR